MLTLKESLIMEIPRQTVAPKRIVMDPELTLLDVRADSISYSRDLTDAYRLKIISMN